MRLFRETLTMTCAGRWDIEELLARKQEIEEGDKLKTRMVV